MASLAALLTLPFPLQGHLRAVATVMVKMAQGPVSPLVSLPTPHLLQQVAGRVTAEGLGMPTCPPGVPSDLPSLFALSCCLFSSLKAGTRCVVSC